MNNKELIKQLRLFRDKAFCHHSHYKAEQIWTQISKYIPYQYYEQMLTEWGHVLCGQGFTQACGALDTEVKKCVSYLESL